MTNQKAGAAAIIAGSVIWTVIMFYHPVHSGGTPLIGRFALSDIVHGAALLAKPILLYGFWCFSSFIGLHRPGVALGLCFYLLATIAMAVAGIVSGWITPEVASAVHAADPGSRAILAEIGRFSVWMNRGLAEVNVVLLSVAYVLWALAWPNGSLGGRLLRAWGFCVGAGVLAWLALGPFEPDPATMPLVVILQSSWAIAVAIVMARTPDQTKEL